MEFFDKLGKKASEAYKVTADKTGKLAKEAKLRMKISELKSQINDIYKECSCNTCGCDICECNRETCDYDDRFTWRHKDEALKLIGDEPNV